jgi:ABC-2 type transport system permease protein
MTIGAMATLITMTFTLSTEVEGVRTVVVNLDGDHHGRRLLQHLYNDQFFEIETGIGQSEAESRLRAGSVDIMLLIPADYSEHIARREPVDVQVIIDGSQPGVAELARNRIFAVVADINRQLILERTHPVSGLNLQAIELLPRIRYNSDLRTIVSVVPGLMGIVLTVPAVGASAALARERERGSFEVVISTPLARWPLLLGRVAPYVVIGLIDIGIFTAVGCLGFGVPMRGDPLLFVLLGLVYVVATASSGVFIAQFLQTQHAAVITTFMLFGITPVYLSDIFFPVLSMPVWLQWLSPLLPATHFTIIARGILLKGIGWSILWPNGLAMLGMSVVMSSLAYARFRKKLD